MRSTENYSVVIMIRDTTLLMTEVMINMFGFTMPLVTGDYQSDINFKNQG